MHKRVLTFISIHLYICPWLTEPHVTYFHAESKYNQMLCQLTSLCHDALEITLKLAFSIYLPLVTEAKELRRSMPHMTFSLHFLKEPLSVQETGIQILSYLYSYNLGGDNLESVNVGTKAGSSKTRHSNITNISVLSFNKD